MVYRNIYTQPAVIYQQPPTVIYQQQQQQPIYYGNNQPPHYSQQQQPQPHLHYSAHAHNATITDTSNGLISWTGNASEADILSLLMLLTGPLICFYGFKLFKTSLGVVAGLLASYSCYILLSSYGSFQLPIEYFIVFIAGLAGILAVFTVVDLGIFLLGATVGGLLSNVIFHAFYLQLNFDSNDSALVRILLL